MENGARGLASEGGDIKSRSNTLLFFVHILLGILSALSSSLTFVWGVIIPVLALYDIINKGNAFDRAARWAAYIVGMEVLLRMRGAFLTFEAAKYYVMALLIVGMAVERVNKKTYVIFIMLFMVLIPSIFLTELSGEQFRKAILFNLSGPFTLIVACAYFYKRVVSPEVVRQILLFLIMPVITTVIVLLFITPDFSTIKFNAESNFETSGGFGPNQVSTIMGCGAFAILLCLVLRFTVTGYPLLDLGLVALFVFRGIMTFSRGGIFSVVIAFVFFILLAIVLNHPLKRRFLKNIILVVPVAFFIWSYAVDITGGQIENRYFGKNARGKAENNLTSGRSNIASGDYQLFLDNPILGVGVGMSKLIREQRYGYLAASHSEFSRLLAEHGSLGVLFLLTLIVIVVSGLISYPSFSKIWLITLIVYALLTVNHAAMRTALPGFIFGLALIIVINNRHLNQTSRGPSIVK